MIRWLLFAWNEPDFSFAPAQPARVLRDTTRNCTIKSRELRETGFLSFVAPLDAEFSWYRGYRCSILRIIISSRSILWASGLRYKRVSAGGLVITRPTTPGIRGMSLATADGGDLENLGCVHVERVFGSSGESVGP